MAKTVYALSACRTALGKFGGGLKDVPAQELGAIVIKEAIRRAGVELTDIDEVTMGCVLQAGLGQNVARQATLKAGLPYEVPAVTINKVCGSGLKAVVMGTQSIIAGDAECVVVGGTENMSRAPFVFNEARWGARMNDKTFVDEMIRDGLWDAFNNYHMGVTAENVSERFGVSREDQDALSLRSQNLAEEAIKTGAFKDEIVPVTIPQKKGDPVVFDTDEFPRFGTTKEALAKLKPAFIKDGTVTAGNASGINDGAAAFVLASEDFVKAHNLKPLFKVVASGSRGVDPAIMGVGPVPSIKLALSKAGWDISKIEAAEINEAFAAQAVQVSRELGMDPEIVNTHGGAIALGHPIGASGARILVTLAYRMLHDDQHFGVASLCIGGGMGEALLIERDGLCQ